MPKKILLISHTEKSLAVHPFGIGEIAHSFKFQTLLEKGNREVIRKDLYELFPHFSDYETLATLNYSLAENGHALLELNRAPYFHVYEQMKRCSAELIFLMTWCWGVAALKGCRLHRLSPTISKLYAFHANEKVILPLYEESDCLVTESLLANQRGHCYGIPLWKMLYMPHQFPKEVESITPDPTYLQKVAHKNGKKMRLGKKTVVIGMPARLEPRKNCGYALTVAAALAHQGHDFIFILKGGCPEAVPAEMEVLKKEPWFFWDDELTSFPQVLREFAVFDICVHLSGYEGASNTIVECLALGKPTVILEGSTNPFLFKGGALFVKSGGFKQGLMPYHLPDEAHLKETLSTLITDVKLREEWGKKGKKIAIERFHPDIAAERVPLLLNAAVEYRQRNYRLRDSLERLFQKDCETYGL